MNDRERARAVRAKLMANPALDTIDTLAAEFAAVRAEERARAEKAVAALAAAVAERDAARRLLHDDGQPVTNAHEGFRDEYADARAAAEGR